MFLIKLLMQYPKVIVSYRNAGLGDNLLAAATAWYYAKGTGRSLMICWVYSRYMIDNKENAFAYFFEPPQEIQGTPIIVEKRIDRLSGIILVHWKYLFPYPDLRCIYHRVIEKMGINKHCSSPPNGQLEFAFDRRKKKEEQIIYELKEVKQKVLVADSCYSPQAKLRPFFDALQLRLRFSSQVEDFAARHFHNKTVIGVHIRYYDKQLPQSSHHAPFWLDPEQSLKLCRDKIQEAVRKAGSANHVIFLATDSASVNDYIKKQFDGVVTFNKEFGTDATKELHEELPVETAAAAIVEMFLLAKSDVLVRFPPQSWFSHYASLYVKEIVI